MVTIHVMVFWVMTITYSWQSQPALEILQCIIINSTELSPFWEATSHSDSQEISCLMESKRSLLCSQGLVHTLLSVEFSHAKESTWVWGPLWHFVTSWILYGEGLLSSPPTIPKLDDYTLSVVHDSLVSTFTATL